jgi:hypothetical protein
MEKRCPRCSTTTKTGASICLGCGDYLYPNFAPYILAFLTFIAALVFVVFVSQQNGFSSHPRRVALAVIGLGPSEDRISAAVLERASEDGLLKRQRSLFTFDIDEAAWSNLSKRDRTEFEEALAQKGYGHKLRKGEIIRLYSATSRRLAAVLRGS